MQRYSEEFRRDAVALVRTSGRPIAQVARALGVNDDTLGNWVNDDDAIELGLSNSKLEGLNSKIRLINHRGYGHHSAAAAALA